MHYSTYHQQRGVATLLMSMIILMVITFITLYTSRTVRMEQKIATNDYRGRMAFEAAETGIEAAMAAINAGWTRNLDVNPADGIPDDVNGDGFPDLRATNVVFDVDLNATEANNVNTLTLSNNSRVGVTLFDDSTGDLIITRVVSVGTSDDGTAQRTITQSIVIVSPLPNIPDTPLLTRGGVVIGGSATINNPEGHSTIWSGGPVDVGGNNTTSTSIANPADPNYPNCLGGSVACGLIQVSTNSVVGLDIIANDSSLANLSGPDFFRNFFGVNPATYRDRSATIIRNGSFPPSGTSGERVWVNGNVSLTGNNTFGTAASPNIIIVDGDLKVVGNQTINGLLFVTGKIWGAGNVTINGSAVITNINSSTGGNVTVNYNSAMLRRLADGGAPAGGGATWRDF
jgi:Tfp pilus assembly protein PilX